MPKKNVLSGKEPIFIVRLDASVSWKSLPGDCYNSYGSSFDHISVFPSWQNHTTSYNLW